MAARNISSSARRSGGKRTVIERPSISAAGYPNIRSAPAFHEVTTPASVLPMMASSEESTMDASRCRPCSPRRRWLMSWKTMTVPNRRPSSS